MASSKATLEGIPMEVQLEILRHFLKNPRTMEVFPRDSYTDHTYGFGSLGILRVSKNLSAIGLSVLYGENDFYISEEAYTLEEFDNSKKYHYDNFEPSTHEHLKSTRWSNMKTLPKDHLTTISGVDCLDLISQTKPGQERLKVQRIDLAKYAMMLFLGGSLLRILRRLRGLQSLELDLRGDWDEFIPTKGFSKSSNLTDGPERFGRDFLLLIKIELGHIKAITLRTNHRFGDTFYISDWISHELEKRNKAWLPPPPAYMDFRRTPSSMSVLHPQVIKLLAEAEDYYKGKKDKKGISYLEDAYGVFS